MIADLKENRENAAKLRKFSRNGFGKPRAEEDQPGLLKAIVDIVSVGAAADGGRQSERLISCLTLDDLVAELANIGYDLSRSATYLRLQPRRSDTTEGRRHVVTVPIKLSRSENNFRRHHQDAHFASATIRYLKDIAVLLGPKTSFVLSQDDKARVPLGLAAANKQSPILMHLNYRVRLPDHDWVVATGHKLVPSIYAALDVGKEHVGYSGPTFITIRSGKHDTSTADTHSADFVDLASLPLFKSAMKNESDVKPVVIVLVDGGPDENPRYAKTIEAAIGHFKRFDFDALFIACHAPGHSAFNPVERRMAPLSHAMAGLILRHETYGSHLDERRRTIDPQLERENFAAAGQVLANIWSSTKIDGYEVLAKYVDPPSERPTRRQMSESSLSEEEWMAKHVRQSQYCLQVVKCHDRSCCSPLRSLYLKLFPDRFIPPPIRYIKTEIGPEVASVEGNVGEFGTLAQRVLYKVLDPETKYPTIPFDLYCPSVQDKLAHRFCSDCGQYFSTVSAKKTHRKLHKIIYSSAKATEINIAAEEEEDDEVEESNENVDLNQSIYVIKDMNYWLNM